jgi:uncharacterized protein (DUF58 family)
MRRAFYSFVEQRLHRWARRRQGSDSGTVALTHGRVYVLPTRTGLILGLALFTMLLGALNYSNNMGFALGFTLLAIAIVSIHQCQRNVADLQVTVTGCAPVFAGDAMRCELRIHNPSRRGRWQLAAGPDRDQPVTTDVAGGQESSLSLTLATTRRGRLDCPPIRIASTWPLGLFRCWAWLYPDRDLLVYPRPVARAPPARQATARDLEASGESVRGADEFVGLRGLAPGEPMSRVAWKALARSGEMLAKDYRSGGGTAWLDWQSLPPVDPETRLSMLTRMVLDAAAENRIFGLRLPGREIPPRGDRDQAHRCLQALAVFEAGTQHAG